MLNSFYLTVKRNGYADLAGYMPSIKHLTIKLYDI